MCSRRARWMSGLSLGIVRVPLPGGSKTLVTPTNRWITAAHKTKRTAVLFAVNPRSQGSGKEFWGPADHMDVNFGRSKGYAVVPDFAAANVRGAELQGVDQPSGPGTGSRAHALEGYRSIIDGLVRGGPEIVDRRPGRGESHRRWVMSMATMSSVGSI